MSNPFTEKNNRFSKEAFFSEDDIKKTQKKVAKSSDHTGTNVNTFLVQNKDKGRDKNKDNRHRENNRNSNNNIFSSKTKQEKSIEFDMKNEDFPELGLSINNNPSEQLNEAKNFLEAVNTIVITEDVSDKIKDGWIVMTKEKMIEGELTQYQKKQKKRSALEATPRFIMEQIHTALCEKWEKRIEEYDALHGDGAYESVYYLPPVYDDFYKYEETDSDYDDNTDNYDIDDYSDYGASDYE